MFCLPKTAWPPTCGRATSSLQVTDPDPLAANVAQEAQVLRVPDVGETLRRPNGGGRKLSAGGRQRGSRLMAQVGS